jgi:hypothetical protein
MRYVVIGAGFALAMAAMFTLSSANAAPPLMSGGKCWDNTANANYRWGACEEEHHKKAHHKGKGKSKKESHHH